MNYKYLLSFLVIGIILIGVWFWQRSKAPAEKPKVLTKKESMSADILTGKKIGMVLAFRDFRDEEYFVPREILEGSGAEIKNISNQKGTARGADGGEIEIDYNLEEAKAKDFDALVFVGGPGCLDNLDNENSYRLVNQAVEKGKLVTAICISPVVLAKAGVLKGKRATVWTSSLDKTPAEILKEYGAIYQDQGVVVDGRIITAKGPSFAQEFAQTIIDTLK